MSTAVDEVEVLAPAPKRRRITSLEVLCGLLILALVGQAWFSRLLDVPAIRTGATVFVAVCTQALPFLVIGVLISGAIAAFVSAGALRKVLPKRAAFAVPVAGVAGIALPTCECAAVPVARRLIVQGAPSSVALAFLIAAPAVNPIVLVATAVAFPGEPKMVLARFAGSPPTRTCTPISSPAPTSLPPARVRRCWPRRPGIAGSTIGGCGTATRWILVGFGFKRWPPRGTPTSTCRSCSWTGSGRWVCSPVAH